MPRSLRAFGCTQRAKDQVRSNVREPDTPVSGVWLLHVVCMLWWVVVLVGVTFVMVVV